MYVLLAVFAVSALLSPLPLCAPLHHLLVLGMTSNNVSDALILWVPYTDRAIVDTTEDSPSQRIWAVVLNSFLNPSTGRTLDRVYSSLGRALENQANHAAHALGLGPDVATQKIKSYFGTGEQRCLQLEALRNSMAPELEKLCRRLLRYTMPCVFLLITKTRLQHVHTQHRSCQDPMPGL